MQRIYEPENLMEGEMLKGMLASEGIEAHLVGRDLLGGTGELPIFGLLGLSVDNDQAEYARELITAYNAALPLPGDEPESFPGRWSVRLTFVLFLSRVAPCVDVMPCFAGTAISRPCPDFPPISRRSGTFPPMIRC